MNELVMCVAIGAYGGESARALIELRGSKNPVLLLDPTGETPPVFAKMRPEFRRRALIYAWIGVGMFVWYVGSNLAVIVRAVL